jgi:L-threonylcarbamoyladenylate synthase
VARAVTARVLDWAHTPQVADALRSGALVVLPTDTVPGFSCLPEAAPALARLRALKGAAAERAFVVLAADAHAVAAWLAPEQDARAWQFVRSVWPAPFTAVLAVRPQTPGGIATAGAHTLAVRVADLPPLAALLRQLPSAVVSTSVNRHGEPPCVATAAIVAAFGDAVDVVVDAGECGPARASTLADCTQWPPRLLRPGGFDLDAALARFGARPDGGAA